MLEYWLGRICPELIQAVHSCCEFIGTRVLSCPEKAYFPRGYSPKSLSFLTSARILKSSQLATWELKQQADPSFLFFFCSLIFWHPLKEKCMLTLLHLPLTEQTFKLWSLLIFSIPMHNWAYKVKIKRIMGKNMYNELQLTELKPVI